MKVKQLIEFLQQLPPDATVRLDDERYPEIDGCYAPDVGEFAADDEDRPPENCVFLEATYPKEDND